MKRVYKTIDLMAVVGKLNNLQCEFLLHKCAGVERFYCGLRISFSVSFMNAQVQFDLASCTCLEKIVTTARQVLRISNVLPIKMGGLSIYLVNDANDYAFLVVFKQARFKLRSCLVVVLLS